MQEAIIFSPFFFYSYACPLRKKYWLNFKGWNCGLSAYLLFIRHCLAHPSNIIVDSKFIGSQVITNGLGSYSTGVASMDPMRQIPYRFDMLTNSES